MLGSSSNGSHAHRHTPGQGQTRHATVPAIPHRIGRAKEKVRLRPRRAASTDAPNTMSQLPIAMNADGTTSSKQTAHNSVSTHKALRAERTTARPRSRLPHSRPRPRPVQEPRLRRITIVEGRLAWASGSIAIWFPDSAGTKYQSGTLSTGPVRYAG
jgi:hypothetical protein